APVFELHDRGDAVEVIAHGVKAARTAILPIRERLEVPVAGKLAAPRITPVDPTVRLIEIDPDTNALSVKLKMERPEVAAMSRVAQAIQVGDDLHVLLPRKLPADGAVVKLPEPTLPPALAAAVAAAPAPKALPAPEVAAPAPPKAAAIVAPRPAPAAPARLATGDDSSSSMSTYGMLGLAAVGVGIWLIRKRKQSALPQSSIEVIAQRSLGGKARIVWLSAGQRELIVSVTPQAVHMLGQWRKDAPMPAALPFAQAEPRLPRAMTQRGERIEAVDAPTVSRTTTSPAVAGILKLRERTMPPVNEDVATGDDAADALWAREILAATGARR
ncbi:MAG TPA: flagellar biosynthetic protein FliO, partial [Kofleriaceae bacterium]|nr:flagellar biosynthetic protein FliO [Kofleriaceae bacterium]